MDSGQENGDDRVGSNFYRAIKVYGHARDREEDCRREGILELIWVDEGNVKWARLRSGA